VIEDLVNWVAPRVGTVRNLRVNVTVNTLLATTTFTIRHSLTCNQPFAPTALSIAVGAGVTGCFLSPNSQAVAPGDRISLEAATGGVAGLIISTGGVEVA
jgi:hypothetical protein